MWIHSISFWFYSQNGFSVNESGACTREWKRVSSLNAMPFEKLIQIQRFPIQLTHVGLYAHGVKTKITVIVLNTEANV